MNLEHEILNRVRQKEIFFASNCISENFLETHKKKQFFIPSFQNIPLTSLAGILFLLSTMSYSQYRSDFKIADSSYKPFFDFDSGGKIHMVWNNEQKWDKSIRYSGFDSTGNVVYPSRKISNTLAAANPKLNIYKDKIACVWEDKVSLDLTIFSTYIKGKILKDGLDYSNELHIDDGDVIPNDAIRYHPEVIWHNDTILYSVWAGDGSLSPGSGPDIYTHKLLLPLPFHKATPYDDVLNNPKIKVNENLPQVIRQSSGSGYLALWVEKDSIGNWDIAGVICDDSLKPTSTKITFASYDTLPYNWMSKLAVFHRANGNIIIAWEKDTTNYRANIYIHEFTEQGIPIGGIIKVNENFAYAASEVSTDIDSEDNFIIVWEDGSDIIAQRYSADMNKIGSNFRLNTQQTGQNFFPCIRLRNRKIFTAWSKYLNGSESIWMNILNFDNPTSIEKERKEFPQTYSLLQNYPNPFNPITVISYHLPVYSFVTLKVYDVLGNEVVTLVNEVKQAGSYEVSFNTQQTTNNRQLSSGVYFYELQASSFVQTKKMIVLK